MKPRWRKTLRFLAWTVPLISLFFLIYAIRTHFVMKEGKLTAISKQVAVIPFDFGSNGHVIIQVKIKGRYYPFILDTGASNSIFNNSLTKDLTDGYKGPAFNIGFYGDFFLNSIYKVEQLAISDFIFEDLSFKKIDLDIPCQEYVGIIGKETMRHLVWKFEPNNSKISVAASVNTFGHFPGDTIMVRENPFSHHLYTNVELNNEEMIEFIIDTGCSCYLTSSELTENEGDLKTITKRVDLNGSRISEGRYGFVKNFSLGNFSLDTTIQVLKGKRLFNVVGMSFLRNFNFILSWKDHFVILQPTNQQRFVSDDFAIDLEFDSHLERAIVKSVIIDSKIYQAGVRIGTSIEMINGKVIKDAETFCSLDYKRSDTLTLKLEGDSRIYRVVKLNYNDFKISR